jgi:hypothetical protein
LPVVVLIVAVLGLVMTESILAARGTVEITQPEQNGTISGVVEIRGSATDDNFGYYQLEYSPHGRAWTTIGQPRYTSQVENGVLGTWDTSKVAPGSYQLRLNLADTMGNRIQNTIQVTVAAPGR